MDEKGGKVLRERDGGFDAFIDESESGILLN
jgi:hypothetical protein